MSSKSLTPTRHDCVMCGAPDAVNHPEAHCFRCLDERRKLLRRRPERERPALRRVQASW
jgi:hypothetical protein